MGKSQIKNPSARGLPFCPGRFQSVSELVQAEAPVAAFSTTLSFAA